VQPIRIEEVKNIAEYELARPEIRPRLMALKDRRRIRAGGHLTFLFENRDTVLYQIHEMMRIERLVRPEEIRHEVETYNELIPGPGELSASLLIEYDSPEERAVWLKKLLGLEHSIWFEVDGQGRAPARFDDRQIATDRISSVQYIKFAFSPAQVQAFRQGARILVDHPAYRAETRLTPQQIEELAADFG